MSLIFGVIFKNGILIADDPFALHNDLEHPQKEINFQKMFTSERLGIVAASVGSLWVFQRFCSYLNGIRSFNLKNLEPILPKWVQLTKEWKNRNKDPVNNVTNNLRQLSDSYCIFARTNNLNEIYIIDYEGNIDKSSSYIFAGSGSYLVEQFLCCNKKTFNPLSPFKNTLKLLLECYRIASRDLFILGFPSIIVISNERIFDFSVEVSKLYSRSNAQYYKNMLSLFN